MAADAVRANFPTILIKENSADMLFSALSSEVETSTFSGVALNGKEAHFG